MSNKIAIRKGYYKNFKIADTTFPLLKPVISENGADSAWIDASAVLGAEYSKILVSLEDYNCY